MENITSNYNSNLFDNKEKDKQIKVGNIDYIVNDCEGGSMQLDPHHHKDNINTPAYQIENSNF